MQHGDAVADERIIVAAVNAVRDEDREPDISELDVHVSSYNKEWYGCRTTRRPTDPEVVVWLASWFPRRHWQFLFLVRPGKRNNYHTAYPSFLLYGYYRAL